MGLMKGSLLESVVPAGEIGKAMIEGDRNLLSHCGLTSDRENFTLNIASRKAAALRRNLVARGLPQQQSNHKTQKGIFKPPVSRHQRKMKIAQANQDQHAQCITKDKERRVNIEHNEGSNHDDNLSQKKASVVPEQTVYVPVKPSNRTSSCISHIVPLKVATRFNRKTSLRPTCENQDLVERVDTCIPFVYPSETDILHQTPVPPLARNLQMPTKAESQGFMTDQTSCLPLANRSPRLVLCELAITKEIMMREQLIRQMKQTVALIDSLATDCGEARDDHKQAQVTLEATTAVFLSLESLDVFTTTAADAAQAQNAVAEAKVVVTKTIARVASLTKRLTYHVHHMDILVKGYQQVTLRVVEGILEWRRSRHRRRQLSNYQQLIRFRWQRQKTTNYLLQIDEDVRLLFPSVALELLLGPEAVYSPLLLARKVLEELSDSFAGKTFLIEKSRCACNGTTPLLPKQRDSCFMNAMNISKLREALASSLKPIDPLLDHDRLKQCLSVIYDEKNLEALEKQRHREEQERVQSAYDPFSTIKSAGGVEETLVKMMPIQSPNLHLLTEQLCTRRGETERVTRLVSVAQTAPVNETFHLNPERLRLFLEKRAAQSMSPPADCELRKISQGQKNKLQGNIVVRRNNEKRIENYFARKIQLQYFAYRQRHRIFRSLTQLARKVHFSVIDIQRIFRGYRAKCKYQFMRTLWREHKQQTAAVRIILNAFRRHRRCLRYRRSMTIESIAQAHYLDMVAKKQNELDNQNTERYRRVGEERRRQRLLLLQKHQLERQKVTAIIQLQSVVRAHLAQNQAKVLRQKRKAHVNAMSAMAIQATIRRYIRARRERVQQLRKDLARVNQSAVRIQAIYRGFSSRSSFLGQRDDDKRRHGIVSFLKGDKNDKYEDRSVARDVVAAESEAMKRHQLPLISTSTSPSPNSRSSFTGRKLERCRISTNSASLPPLHDRDQSFLLSSTSPAGTSRRLSIGMTRIELKLKEAEIKAIFDPPPSRRSSFFGSMRPIT